MKPLLFASLIALPLLTLLGACGDDGQTAERAGYHKIAVGDVYLQMELAVTSDEQRRGLMHREGIGENEGMLFIFSEPQSMSFWMKNVSFPIDIGYFTADGVLREVYPMYAHDTQGRKSIRDDLLYVLEVPSGWFKRNNVRPGAKLDVEAVEQVLDQR